ncbi:class I SAM-dependent methyltransferase [Pseudovibrio exalbescens]|uniref:class I SAM-dependent methyltransferase n=1 Tax=Pseudovibrio exalbescens TaxID=197461 RepID=UPI000C9B96CF|nr:class I SAM-dependent methyltransferase [Pseudovibrio exalbescens]
MGLDIIETMEKLAAESSAQYAISHMLTAKNFKTLHDIHKWAMGKTQHQGHILEFGVGSGNTLRLISNLTDSEVFGFDVFSGLPEDWRTGFEKGTFKQEKPPKTNINAKIVEGLFEESLPIFIERSNISFVKYLHIDCDLYSSTRTVFKNLFQFITPETIIVFDEYFNYAGWEQHEHKAFMEFLEEKGATPRYLAFRSNHQQVVAKFSYNKCDKQL